MKAGCKVVLRSTICDFLLLLHAELLTVRCMCAQIADFGMAQTLSADDSYVSTETLGE